MRKTAKKIIAILSTVLFLAPFVSYAALTDSLTSYYKMEDTADSHGSNTLTDRGGSTFNAGKILNALGGDFRIAGTGGLYRTFLGLSDNFTVNIWMKSGATTSESPFFFDGGGGTGIAQKIQSGTWYWSDNNTFWHSISASIATGWHMYTFIRESGVTKAYLDGTDLSYSDSASFTAASANYLAFGNGFWSSAWQYNGQEVEQIDEVGIWARVLSSSEITQLYNSGSGLAYPFTVAASFNGGDDDWWSWFLSFFF